MADNEKPQEPGFTECAKKDVTVTFRTIAHVYDGDDPTSEAARELSDRAEEEIGKSVAQFLKMVPSSEQGDLILCLPAPDLTDQRKDDIPRSVRLHFYDRIQDLERDRNLIWWAGLREFRLTIAVLIPALLGIASTSLFSKDIFALIVQNILIICCWVVVWQPFQTLVFDRWTLAVRIRVYQHITSMPIQVRPYERVFAENRARERKEEN